MQEKLRRKQRVQRPELRLTPARFAKRPKQRMFRQPEITKIQSFAIREKQPAPPKATPETPTAKTAAQSSRQAKQSQRKPTPGMQEKLRRKQRVQRPELRLTPARFAKRPKQRMFRQPEITKIQSFAIREKQPAPPKATPETPTAKTAAQSSRQAKQSQRKPTPGMQGKLRRKQRV